MYSVWINAYDVGWGEYEDELITEDQVRESIQACFEDYGPNAEIKVIKSIELDVTKDFV